MAVDALGSNSSSSTLELLKELREAKKAMEASVQSGDIQGAQQNLATIQRDTQTLQAGRGTSDGPQEGNPYRSVLKTDLSNLMSAVQSGDIGSAQSALETFQQDKQAIFGPAPNDAAANAGSATGNPFLDDLKALLTSAVSGDSSGVEKAATALQKDLQSASVDGTAGSTQPADTASASGHSQNPFVTDLNALIDAAQSKDTAGMQRAAKDLAKDIQSAVGGAPGGKVGGHHHHHHHKSADGDSATNGTTSASAALPSAGDGDGDKDDQGPSAAAQASVTNTALKNAREAYELLMSYSQESTAVA
jgi:ribosomal protein S20